MSVEQFVTDLFHNSPLFTAAAALLGGVGVWCVLWAGRGFSPKYADGGNPAGLRPRQPLWPRPSIPTPPAEGIPPTQALGGSNIVPFVPDDSWFLPADTLPSDGVINNTWHDSTEIDWPQRHEPRLSNRRVEILKDEA